METIRSFLERWDLLGFVIAAIISLLVGLLYKALKNLLSMKRKPYNISRQTVSRTVYDNRIEGDFSITVSYRGNAFDEPLTMLRIRLLNDGENDISFIQKCVKPVHVEIDAEIVDVFLEPATDGIEASLAKTGKGKYKLTWTLLKRDEYIDIAIVAKGKDFKSEQVRTSIRAEGIDKIKSPEYRVWPQLWPILLFGAFMIAGSWFLMPSEITFIPQIQENVFWMVLSMILVLLYIIMVLVKRVKWQKE